MSGCFLQIEASAIKFDKKPRLEVKKSVTVMPFFSRCIFHRHLPAFHNANVAIEPTTSSPICFAQKNFAPGNPPTYPRTNLLEHRGLKNQPS